MDSKEDAEEINRWEIEQIKQAVREADAGLFATDEEVKNLFDYLKRRGLQGPSPGQRDDRK